MLWASRWENYEERSERVNVVGYAGRRYAGRRYNSLLSLRSSHPVLQPSCAPAVQPHLSEVRHEKLHRHEDRHHAVPPIVHGDDVDKENREGGDVEVSNDVHEVLVHEIGGDGMVPLELKRGLSDEWELDVPGIVQRDVENTREEVVVEVGHD